MLAAVTATILVYAAWVLAYVPATSTNNTNAISQTNISQLAMKWSAGTYSSIVSYQLAESNSMGFHQGVLVHFSELHLNNDKPNMPWIALINCDANKTDNSQVDDIFTLAWHRGAVAVLLYSNMSETCLVDPGYANPGSFEHTLDIFTTQTKTSARLMLSQFSNIRNISFMNYDPALLNSATQVVNDSLTSNAISSGFIVATLRAANFIIAINGSETGNSSSSSPQGLAQNPNSNLAMIILYAITGCITSLFIAVMISGGLRAIRHPERYGPRAPAVNGLGEYIHGQTRTAGLGQAILDTFPLMKFGQITGSSLEGTTDVKNPPRIHSEEAEGKEGDRMHTASTSVPTSTGSRFADSSNDVNESSSSPKCPSYSSSSPSRPADVHSRAIGHETCPICLDDFEAEDDIRVLPCEGKHKFHQACVDHWLLDLSSSCPLCREDFHARELILSETDEDRVQVVPSRQDTGISPIAWRSARISRYPMRFAPWCNRDTQVLEPAEDSGHPGSELP